MWYILEFLLACIVLGLATECLSELLVKDEVLDKFRLRLVEMSSRIKVFRWKPNISEFLASLLTCGRCMSGWVAMLFAFALVTTQTIFWQPTPLLKINLICYFYISMAYLITWLVTWRLANVWHFIIDRLDRSKGKDVEEVN